MSVLDLLARTLTAEAGGEGVPGLLAAGSVIANRVKAGTYGDGFEGVIMRPGQFSAWNGVTGYAGGQGALNMDRIRPTPEAMAVSEAILQGRLADPTGGATHYYNPNAANPAWGANRAGGDWLTIGNHIFGNPDGRPGSSEPRPTQPQPQATMSTMNTTEAEPMPGLLGRIGQQVTERMPFLQDKDRMARLAMAIEGMTLNPNQALMGSLQQGIEGRQDEDRMNRTAEWLAAQPGGGQFAAAIAAGGNAGQVMQSYFESQQGMSPYEAAQTDYVRAQTDALLNPVPEDNSTAAMQNYEYLVAQGMDPIKAMDQAFGSGGTNIELNTGDQVDPRPAIGTPASGFQYIYNPETQGYEAQPIPGGPEDPTQREEASRNSDIVSAQVITTAASRARELASAGMTTGTPGRVAANLSETNAAELRRQVGVLTANATIENLNAMRQQSPTGGALGNVTEGEGKMLAAKAGAIDPNASREDFLRAIDDYERTLLHIVHGTAPEADAAPQTAPQSAPDFSGMTMDELSTLDSSGMSLDDLRARNAAMQALLAGQGG